MLHLVVSVELGKTRYARRSEEHTSELQSQSNLVCRLLLEKKKQRTTHSVPSTPYITMISCCRSAVMTVMRYMCLRPVTRATLIVLSTLNLTSHVAARQCA